MPNDTAASKHPGGLHWSYAVEGWPGVRKGLGAVLSAAEAGRGDW